MSSSAEHFQPRLRSRKLAGLAFGTACFLATLSGVVVLVVLLGSVLTAAVGRYTPGGEPEPSIRASQLPGTLVKLATQFQSTEPEDAGFKAGIVGSIWLLVLVVVIAIPVGVGAAIFLEEFAPPGRLKNLIQLNLANLAGVPSIVYGIL